MDENDLVGGVPERCTLEPGALINGEIVITSYFDANGKMKYAVSTVGNMNIAQVVGLCALGAMAVHQKYEVDNDDVERENDGED